MQRSKSRAAATAPLRARLEPQRHVQTIGVRGDQLQRQVPTLHADEAVQPTLSSRDSGQLKLTSSPQLVVAQRMSSLNSR